jgi:hypothetical protein
MLQLTLPQKPKKVLQNIFKNIMMSTEDYWLCI